MAYMKDIAWKVEFCSSEYIIPLLAEFGNCANGKTDQKSDRADRPDSADADLIVDINKIGKIEKIGKKDKPSEVCKMDKMFARQ